MNKKYVLYNLREAGEELMRTISDVEADSAYGYPEYMVAMR